MARQLSMPYQFPPIHTLKPATDAAGRTGIWSSLANCEKAWMIVYVDQANAATILLSLLQATSKTGTGSKATNSVPIWANQDCVTSDALVAQTAGATFTTSAATKAKMVIFEITPDVALDVTNGFNHVTVSTGASDVANITSALLVSFSAYQQSAPPTTIV